MCACIVYTFEKYRTRIYKIQAVHDSHCPHSKGQLKHSLKGVKCDLGCSEEERLKDTVSPENDRATEREVQGIRKPPTPGR